MRKNIRLISVLICVLLFSGCSFTPESAVKTYLNDLKTGKGISIIEYLIICGIVVGFFVTKKVIYILQGNICKSSTETKEYLFNINVYNRILAVLLLPISMIITFSKLSNLNWPVFIGLSLVCTCYLFVILRGMKILIQKRFSIFYLILYLCTLEILPFLYIYKLVLE